MASFVYRHRVRYRECDPMGFVYHTHYLDYFEAARTEALRGMGLAYRELEEAGTIMPVVDAGLRYHGPAHYDDLLEIESDFGTEVPSTRIRIQYTVRRAGESKPLVSGHVTLCFVDVARNRPVRAPESIRAVFLRALDAN